MITVAEVIKPAAKSVGWEEGRFLKAVVQFVKPSGHGNSDPTRETILGYERWPATRCGHKFAAMVIDFLEQRASPIVDDTARREARAACLVVLKLNQDNRYRQPPRNNPASLHRIDECAGCYVLIRRSTTDTSIREELLVLATDGRRDPTTHATYASQELLCRGTWSIVRDTVSCIMNGYRGNYARPDIVNLHLVYEQPPSSEEPALLRGFGVGLTRQSAQPAMVPVIAIRLLDPKETMASTISHLGNTGDHEVRRFLATIATSNPGAAAKFGEILDHSLAHDHGITTPVSGDLRARIEQHVGKLGAYVSGTILDRCKSFCIEDASLDRSLEPSTEMPAAAKG